MSMVGAIAKGHERSAPARTPAWKQVQKRDQASDQAMRSVIFPMIDRNSPEKTSRKPPAVNRVFSIRSTRRAANCGLLTNQQSQEWGKRVTGVLERGSISAWRPADAMGSNPAECALVFDLRLLHGVKAWNGVISRPHAAHGYNEKVRAVVGWDGQKVVRENFCRRSLIGSSLLLRISNRKR